jgi:LysR family transcriptional regulator, benzoate and cis,cis-muconate-responsive activator of ben and cat genes
MNASISLRQLRYFVAVAEELNFRRAAERLHITQPPLSRQIGELESAIGLPLLWRDTRSVRLTPAGEAALQQFRTLLAQFDSALQSVRGAAAALPPLRLGVPNWIDLQGLAGVEQQLQRRGLAGHRFMAGQPTGLDLQGLQQAVLGQLPFAAFVPATSALARRRRVALADLNDVPPFYRFRRALNPLLYEHFARQYEAHGFTPLRDAPAPDVMGVFAKIGSGRGCTCMPVQLAVHRYAGVVRRPLREAVTMDIALVHPPGMADERRAVLTDSARHLIDGLLR